jgi:hypothetical protein
LRYSYLAYLLAIQQTGLRLIDVDVAAAHLKMELLLHLGLGVVIIRPK